MDETFYNAMCLTVAIIFALIIGFYLFLYLPRSEQLKALEKENKRLRKENNNLSALASECAKDRIEDAALYSEKLFDLQQQVVDTQKAGDARAAELQKEAERQRMNAETWAGKFDEYRKKMLGAGGKTPEQPVVAEVGGDAA